MSPFLSSTLFEKVGQPLRHAALIHASRPRWYHEQKMQRLLEDLAPGDPDWELARAIDPARLPAHIAIIMDGNGRWAKRRRLPRIAGHRAGISAVRQAVEACARLGVPCLTLYAFSVENWKRPHTEIKLLMGLLREYLKKEIRELNRQNI